MYYLHKFDKAVLWVIPEIKSTNLCKPIHEIICPFDFGKSKKERKKLQKSEYLENKKSFFDEIKKHFL